MEVFIGKTACFGFTSAGIVGVGVVLLTLSVSYAIQKVLSNYTKNEQKSKQIPQYKQRTPQKVKQKRDTDQKTKREKKYCTCTPINLSVFYVNIQSVNPIQKNQEKLASAKAHILATRPDIVAMVETWSRGKSSESEDVLRNKLGLDGYVFFTHYRKDSWDFTERGRRGGGFLVAYNICQLFEKGFSMKPVPEYSDDFSRFFSLSRTFKCAGCSRTGAYLGCTGLQVYYFVLHYRRPGPFNKTRTLPAESRMEYLRKNESALFNLISAPIFQKQQFTPGAVIVGDFNLIESQNEWEDLVEQLRTNGRFWKRAIVGLNETTTERNSPDGVICFPSEFVNPIVNLTSMNTVHKGLNFQLEFGNDSNVSCPVCSLLS